MTLLELPSSIRLVEVGLRDGLQAVPEPWRTEDKVRVIEGLIAAGVREIEAVSFAHPKVLPQLADAEAVMADAPRVEGVRYRGLVPNLRGAQRAAGCDLDEWVVVVPVDEEVALRNQRRTVTQLLEELDQVGELAREHRVRLVVAVATAFFAPARGEVPLEDTLSVVDAAVAAGADGVYLAATSGQEHPVEMADGIAQVRARHTGLDVGVHLHNRNGFAPANALLAMAAGATWLEGSFAGLGGDLWFPGDPTVLGNAPMEDLIHLCESIGVSTGISLTDYLDVVSQVEELTGTPSTSFVTRGGSRDDLAGASWPSSTGDSLS
jgi:hydroxymethylglutaryl-CoA lyase